MASPDVLPKPDSGRPAARALLIPNPKLKLADQCREVLRFKHYAYRTEQSYVDWIRRFIVWARDCTSAECGAALSVSGPPSPRPGRTLSSAEASPAAQREGVIVDSTVQSKAIAHPVDSRLLEIARHKVVSAAKRAGDRKSVV